MLVGGKGSFEATLCAYLYVICPLYLALVVLDAVTLGALSSWNRDAALRWSLARELSQADIDALFAARPGLGAGVALLLLAQILTMVIWMLICWPVYRGIHQVSRLRSAVAYVLAFAAVLALAPVFTAPPARAARRQPADDSSDAGTPRGAVSLELRVARSYSSRQGEHQLDRAATSDRPVRARDHLSARLGDRPLRLPLRLLHVRAHGVPAQGRAPDARGARPALLGLRRPRGARSSASPAASPWCARGS